MAKLKSITLDDGTVIMIESTEEVQPVDEQFTSGEQRLVSKGITDDAITQFKNIRETIRDYTTYTLQAFEQVAAANINKVTLEFGVKIGGEAGIPYITKGTAESNLKITVECSFPKN
ncbi:MAG TPA: CU044_2847 family protein [Thermodesulfovibrionia bacterium]|nr:CU044_2847 family protein [Thermodesulfovibrionia bacterium]